MGLERILQLLGAEAPFDEKDGTLTEAGQIAMNKLEELIDNLDYIGAVGKKGDEFLTYCDEIIRLGF